MGHRCFQHRLTPIGMETPTMPHATSVPFGFCHCGCGNKTTIAKITRARLGHIKGQPTPYLSGHGAVERDWAVSQEPFVHDGTMCRYIPLTRGQKAIVEDAMFESLNRWIWFALWSDTSKGYYVARRIDSGRTEMMHRQLLELPHGDERRGDHINHNTLDNRRSNLRIADPTQSAINTRLRFSSTSGLKGVSWHKGHQRWKSSIRVNKVLIHLGYFGTAEAAHLAYREAAQKHFGEFACLT